jgi:cation diffusion facilitator CzcD-associated flavoprotein CzcO
MARPHIVIVGAGFGGLAAAHGLAGAAVDVTVIDRRNYHLFQPLLYQVATAGLSPAQIARPSAPSCGMPPTYGSFSAGSAASTRSVDWSQSIRARSHTTIWSWRRAPGTLTSVTMTGNVQPRA